MNPAILLSVGAGVLSALPMMLALTTAGGIMFILVSPLPLFLAGLSFGTQAAVIAGATASVTLGLAGGALAATAMVVVLAGPAMLLVRQALLHRPATAADGTRYQEWYPAGLLLTALTLIGVTWLVVGSGLKLGVEGGIEASLRSDIAQSLEMLIPQASPGERARAAAAITPLAMGAGLLSWLLLLGLNGILAQGLLVRYGRNLRPSPKLSEIELPNWLAPVLAATLLAAFLIEGDLGYLAQNLAVVLVLPYFFLGLSVVHALTMGMNARTVILTIFYIALVVLSIWPSVIVIALGLIEQWAGLRRRVSRADPDSEED